MRRRAVLANKDGIEVFGKFDVELEPWEVARRNAQTAQAPPIDPERQAKHDEVMAIPRWFAKRAAVKALTGKAPESGEEAAALMKAWLAS